MHAGSEWQLVEIESSGEGGQRETGEHRRETEALEGDKVIGGAEETSAWCHVRSRRRTEWTESRHRGGQ